MDKVDQNTTEPLADTPETHAVTKIAKAPELMRNIESMMSQINHLSTIYHTETEALRRADTDTFRDLQHEKEMQVMEYERRFDALMERKEDLRSLDNKTKERLQEMQKEFSALVEDNALVLNRMQDTTKRINNLVLKATRRAVHNDMAVSYGSNGKLEVEQRRALSTGRVKSEA